MLQEVSSSVGSLVRMSLELDSWIRHVLGEEELLVWHVGELLCDLRETEIRIAEMAGRRERAIAIDMLHEHCADILDYIVPHWPLHIAPLRERVELCCRDMLGNSEIGLPSMACDSLLEHNDSALVPTEGIDALVTAVDDFRVWLNQEGVLLSATQAMRGLLVDVKSIHKMLFHILSLRKIDKLGPSLLAFSDSVEIMLVRWSEDTGHLRSWLNERVLAHEGVENDE
ncbi:hypothetical protein WMF26_48590 [Sorangium sp. So ce185]|uniref:hypothetical protein n=1 Tax=Sorangium sp. So ce185 TaxID=3133287 RepID=UPI003F5EF6A3